MAVVAEEGEVAAVVDEVAAAVVERGWEAAAGCRGLRHRWVGRRRLAAGPDQVAGCRGRREVCRAPLVESALVAHVLAESALVVLALAELAGPDQLAGRPLRA